MSELLPTVLLVEDSPDDRFLIERAIRRSARPVSVRSVGNGEEALAYLGGEGRFADRLQYPLPRLVLLDWKLSRRSGLEVLRWVRARPGLDAMPVVVLTSSGEEEDMRQAFGARANSYLQKPGISAEFVELMSCTLDYWLRFNLQPVHPQRG